MSDPVAVVFVVKIYQEKNKRMKENMKEYRSQHEEKVRKEGEKMILDWLQLKKIVSRGTSIAEENKDKLSCSGLIILLFKRLYHLFW